MKALAFFVPLLAAGLIAGAALTGRPLQQDPNLLADIQSGACVRRVVEYTAFLPPRIQVALADAGFPITPTLVPYKRLLGRAFVCSFTDGGSLFIPPRLSAFAELFRMDLVTTVAPCGTVDAGTLCPGTEDGQDNGTPDPVQEDVFECGCSTGASCSYVATGGFDGGAAPTGLTLAPGSFTGLGCRKKACGMLWLTQPNPDGGANVLVDSFPNACPAP